MTNIDTSIPTFLKRKETAKAAKKFADEQKVEKLAKAKAAVAKVVAVVNEKTKAGELFEKTAIEQINEARKKDGLRPYQPKAKVPKKAGTLVAKAVEQRDKLAKAAKEVAAKSASKPTSAEKAKSKSAPKKGGKIARYDWNGAEEDAAKGVVPKAPDMSAWTHRYFVGALADVEKLVKAKNVKALQAMKFARTTGSPGMVNRYRKIAITALTFKK